MMNPPSHHNRFWPLSLDSSATIEAESRCRCASIALACSLVVVLSVFVFMLADLAAGNFTVHADFQVDSVSFSPPKSSDFNANPPTANWTIGISVRNPGRHVITVYDIEVSVLYNLNNDNVVADTWMSQKILTTEHIKSFHLVPKEHTKISSIHKAALLENSVAGAILKDTTDGIVDFDLSFGYKTRFPVLFGWAHDHVPSELHCRKLSLRHSTAMQNTFMADEFHKCSFVGISN